MRNLLLVIAALLIHALLAPSLYATQPVVPEADLIGKPILSIQLQADQAIENPYYLNSLGVKVGEAFSRSGLKMAIQALYDTGRFSSVVVEATPSREGVELSFKVQWNYYFNRFSIEGKVDLGGRAVWEAMSLPVGERFTADRLEESRQTMLRFMQDRGYFKAQVRARAVKDEQNRQVDVVFEVAPGERAVIRSIELEGVPDLEMERVRQKFGFKPGQPYNRVRQRRRRDDLKSYFVARGYLEAVVEVSDSFNSSDNTVSLVLKVSRLDKVYVTVGGFRIGKDRLRRLLPVLTGEGLDPEILQEGVRNLGEYLEEQGYPEAQVEVTVKQDKSGGPSVHYAISTGRKVTIKYIRFRGNHSLTDEELLAAVQTQRSSIFQKSAYSISGLDADVAALSTLFKSKGFLHARVIPLVEPVRDGTVLGITFDCNEGSRARVGSLKIQGNRTFSSEHLEAGIQLKPDRPYSPYAAEQDRQLLLSKYNDAGFLQPSVSVQATAEADPNLYQIVYEIHEGVQAFVDRVLILGNDWTRPSVISGKIHLRPTEPLSLGKMLSTQQALYKLGVFDLVRVAPQNAGSVAALQNVVVRLQESKRFTIRYGVGYQERERLRGTVELSDLNVFGTGRRIDLRLRGSSVEQSGILSLPPPQIRFLPVDSYFTLSGGKTREVSFDVRRVETSYQFGRNLNDHSWALLRYNFRNVRISQYDKNLTPEQLGRENTPRNLSTFSVYYINDTRDNYLDAEKGFFTSTNFSVTTKLLGSNDYYSLFTQNSYFRKLWASLLLASSFRFGVSHPFGGDTELPISERYFAGGGSSLRGFDTDMAGPLNPATNRPVGGNALILGNIELRVALMRSVQLVPFYDTGNVFSSSSAIRLDGLSHTFGLGLRIRTPFGPLRADYGLNLNLSQDLRSRGLKSGHFFITIGPPF